MDRKTIVYIVVLILSASRASFAQDASPCPRPRLISVQGTAEINVDPDQVVMRFGVVTKDKELSVAKLQHDERTKKVIALARNAGIESKHIQTDWLSIRPDYSEEKVPRLLGYEVSQTLTITLKDISKYESLVTKLLEAGVNQVNGVYFSLSENRKYKDEARAKAIRAAKEKATAMAGELGQSIGKPWEISEADTSPFYRPTANAIYGYAGLPETQEGSTVAPGQVTIRASVTVSFQLE